MHRAATARIDRFRRTLALPLSEEPAVAVQDAPTCSGLTLLNVGPGGFGDLTAFFTQLPADFSSAVVVLQSLPPALMDALADYFNRRCHLPVVPLADNSPLACGHCYLATNGRAMRFTQGDGRTLLQLETETEAGFDRHLG